MVAGAPCSEKSGFEFIHTTTYPWIVEFLCSSCVHHTQQNFAEHVQRLALTGTIHHVWRERNERIFANEWRPTRVVLKSIINYVKAVTAA